MAREADLQYLVDKILSWSWSDSLPRTWPGTQKMGLRRLCIFSRNGGRVVLRKIFKPGNLPVIYQGWVWGPVIYWYFTGNLFHVTESRDILARNFIMITEF